MGGHSTLVMTSSDKYNIMPSFNKRTYRPPLFLAKYYETVLFAALASRLP